VRLTVSRYIGGSRKRLAKALGRKPDNVVDWQAHHIIPYLEFDKTVAGQQCKRILEKAGIGINDKVNGVWMEKVYHTRALHSREYIDELSRRLANAEKKALAIDPNDVAALRKRIEGVLAGVGSALSRDPYVFP